MKLTYLIPLFICLQFSSVLFAQKLDLLLGINQTNYITKNKLNFGNNVGIKTTFIKRLDIGVQLANRKINSERGLLDGIYDGAPITEDLRIKQIETFFLFKINRKQQRINHFIGIQNINILKSKRIATPRRTYLPTTDYIDIRTYDSKKVNWQLYYKMSIDLKYKNLIPKLALIISNDLNNWYYKNTINESQTTLSKIKAYYFGIQTEIKLF